MHLSILDWAVIALFMIGNLALAHWARGSHANLAQYFLADRGLSWFTAGLCLFATLFSTVSFVAIPGEAYKNGVLFSLKSMGYALFTPLAVWLFVRFFYQTTSFTAYEYFERRFNRPVRVLAALVFLVSRALYVAVVFYSAAKIFESLLGWSPWITIVGVGLFTVYYSFHGGMRAIVVTDVLQSAIMIGAIVFISLKLCALIGFDFGGLWQAVRATGRGFDALSQPEFYTLDPYARYTFWTTLIVALLGPLTNYGTDQLFVQRMLSTKNYQGAKNAIWLKTWISLPVMLVLYLIGLLLFYYYGRVAVGQGELSADHVLGHFINQHLPSPLPGLVAAALLAALMSTVSATSATLATVTVMDIIAFLPGLRTWRHRQSVALGKVLTGVWGLLAIGLAMVLIYAGRGLETTVLEVSQVWASLWLILLVIVLGGILTTWVTARAAFVALAVGIVCNLAAPYWFYYRVPAAERISFVWVGFPGLLIAILLIAVVSAFDRHRKSRAELRGLTFRTLPREQNRSERGEGGESRPPPRL